MLFVNVIRSVGIMFQRKRKQFPAIEFMLNVVGHINGFQVTVSPLGLSNTLGFIFLPEYQSNL